MIAIIVVAPLFMLIPFAFYDWIKELDEPINYGPEEKV